MRNLAENTSDQTYKLMNLVDQADVIMYYADGNGDYYSTTKLLNYAKYRDNINSKPLYTIYSDSNISNMYKAGDSILIINTNSNDTTLLKTKVKNATVLTTDDTIQEGTYNRKDAAKDNKTLYIFTDNTDRTSGGKVISDGWYKTKYGNGGFGSENNPTTAVLRGLDNAAPISTMKYFYRNHPNMSVNQARWTDNDFTIFKETIDDEIEDIKFLWDSGDFDNITVPSGDGFFNSKIANISKQRTPKLYEYLRSKLIELNNYVNNVDNSIISKLAELGKQRKNECNG